MQHYLPKGLDGVALEMDRAWCMATADLAWGQDGRSRLMLLRVAAGRPVPEHGHGGQELTLILSGAYRDRFGVFAAKGDIADHDEEVEHQPIAEPGAMIAFAWWRSDAQADLPRPVDAGAAAPVRAMTYATGRGLDHRRRLRHWRRRGTICWPSAAETVAISGRREDKLASRCSRVILTISSYPLDVTDGAAIARQAVQQDCRRRWAGSTFSSLALPPGSRWMLAITTMTKFSARSWTPIILGVIRVANPLLAQMTRQGGGHFAVIASVAGYFGLPRSAAYSSTKAGLINLLETMRTELAPRNIKVRMVAYRVLSNPS